MSSELEFLDVLYLGIFVILSPAFDDRFYHGNKPQPSLLEEISYAISHFHSLLHNFSERFIILLDGEAMSHSYVVNKMLAEFSAASVVFSNAVEDSGVRAEGSVSSTVFAGRIEEILRENYPEAFPYYSRCLDRKQKNFIWTGPSIEIVSRSREILLILPLMTKGEQLEHPCQNIYPIDLDSSPPTTPNTKSHAWKRRGRGNSVVSVEEHPKKRIRGA